MTEDFTDAERATLTRYFTNVDDDVFGLVNLPEVVKGALFARYSRSARGLRRLFLDEFAADLAGSVDGGPAAVGVERAEALYDKVFDQYGDDSVAQLGGAHVAVENLSNLMTKQVEWGRLAAYLEQSTRYVPYDDRPGGLRRYYRDPDIVAGPHGDAYVGALDAIFDAYADLLPQVRRWVRAEFPHDGATPEGAWKRATRAKALDVLRGLLPAATTSNLGVFATGQAYEQMLLRLQSLPLAEARHVSGRLLTELRAIIPSFLTRVDRPDRGVAWSEYLAATRDETRDVAADLLGDVEPDAAPPVTLVDWSPRDPARAEVELTTAALYAACDLPEQQLRQQVERMSTDERARVLAAYVGGRRNRRHKPGRAFERVWYRFDVLGDYGGFRDLQRHRMLTIEWQDLTPRHGYDTPSEIERAGVAAPWHRALERSAGLHARLLGDHPVAAQYAVSFAYRIRYVMQMNAREAMHMLELRSTPQGHPQYRSIVQRMHELIRDRAGHGAVAGAMHHVDHGAAELERLESERRAEERRRRSADAPPGRS